MIAPLHGLRSGGFLFAVLLPVCTWAPPALSQTPALWRYDAAADIRWVTMTPNDTLLLATAEQLMALDPATGKPLWTRSGLHGTGEKGEWWFPIFIDSTAGLLDFGDHLEILNLHSGEKRWDTTNQPITRLKGYLTAPQGLLLVLAATRTDSSVLFGFDVVTGQPRWQHRNPFLVEPKRYRQLTSSDERVGTSLRGEQPAVAVSDSTFLLYVSEDGPVLVNGRTGEFLWRATDLAGKRPPASRDLYPPMLIADSVVYVPREKELFALRLRNGTSLWPSPAQFSSRLRQLTLTPIGILVRGVGRYHDAPQDGSFVDVLHPSTGTSRWPERYQKGFNVLTKSPAPWISPVLVVGPALYFASKGKLHRIDIVTGRHVEVGKVKFKGDEEPTFVEARPRGIFLLAPQNAALVDSTGTTLYDAYYPGPSHSFGLFGLFHDRHGKTFHNSDFFFGLTAQDSAGQPRISIVKVSKDQNQVLGRVAVTDSTTSYELDDAGTTVFVITGPRVLSALKF